MSRLFLLLGAFALFVAACSGETAVTTATAIATTTDPTAATTTDPTATPSSPSDSSTTSSSTTTTVARATTTTIDQSTTVTTIPEGFASPINGLPAVRDALLDKRAIAIKVHDEPLARPQSGVMDADSMIEMRMGGGKTRWIAIFHDNESDYVGPMRSLRPTDSTLMAALGTPLAYSGGQFWIEQLARDRNIDFIMTDSSSRESDLAAKLESQDGKPEFSNGKSHWCLDCAFRIPERVPPHNLYTRTDLVRQGADAMGASNDPPQSLYPIVQWTIPETKADQIVLEWSDSLTIKWEWDGDRYLRSILGQNGYFAHEVADREGNTQQIAVDVLVILAGNLHDQFPPAGTDGSGVPTTDTLGSGQAWVFSRGAVWEGRWERAEYEEQFRLIGADGADTGVPAGFSWVSVFPDDRTVTWE